VGFAAFAFGLSGRLSTTLSRGCWSPVSFGGTAGIHGALSWPQRPFASPVGGVKAGNRQADHAIGGQRPTGPKMPGSCIRSDIYIGLAGVRGGVESKPRDRRRVGSSHPPPPLFFG